MQELSAKPKVPDYPRPPSQQPAVLLHVLQRPVQTCPGPIHPNGSLLRASAQSPRAVLASIFRRSRTGAVPDSNCCLGLSPALCIPPPAPRPTGHVPLRAASSPTGLFHGCAIPGRGATRASLSRGRGANCPTQSLMHVRTLLHELGEVSILEPVVSFEDNKAI